MALPKESKPRCRYQWDGDDNIFETYNDSHDRSRSFAERGSPKKREPGPFACSDPESGVYFDGFNPKLGRGWPYSLNIKHRHDHAPGTTLRNGLTHRHYPSHKGHVMIYDDVDVPPRKKAKNIVAGWSHGYRLCRKNKRNPLVYGIPNRYD